MISFFLMNNCNGKFFLEMRMNKRRRIKKKKHVSSLLKIDFNFQMFHDLNIIKISYLTNFIYIIQLEYFSIVFITTQMQTIVQ